MTSGEDAQRVFVIWYEGDPLSHEEQIADVLATLAFPFDGCERQALRCADMLASDFGGNVEDAG